MLGRSVLVAILLLPSGVAQRIPPNTEAALDKGIQDFQQQHYVDAQRDLEKAVLLSPADARAITYLALTRAALGDCSAPAIDELRLQAYRNADPEIRRLSGLAVVRCLLLYNRTANAMPMLTQLRNAFPDDADVLYESTQVLNQAWSAAVRELRQKAPNSFRLNQLSAQLLENQARYSEAAAEYRKAIEKAPAALGLHYHLGRALLLGGHDPESLESARQAFEGELKLNPSDAVAEYQIGQTYVSGQNADKAAEHFQRSLELAPNFAEAMIALAKLKIEGQNYKEAIALLERAVELQPAMEAARSNLILAYRAAGKNKQADREQAELKKLHERK
jgi:tetratricopeptide (TPR) repeat protein